MAKDTPTQSKEPEVAQPRSPLPPIKESPIPVVESANAAETGHDDCKLPEDGDFTHGLYEMNSEKYALCIHAPDGYGNTHTLKNTLHTWQGTKEQFNASFTRV